MLGFLLLAAACAPHKADNADPNPVRFDGTVPVAGAVAADHELASQAGAEVLHAGGNAVDAAIAAALASGVVQPAGSGLGGGGFALLAPPHGEAIVLDFREVAPAGASMTQFEGGASSTTGGSAVAVPTEGIGLAELHRRFGRASLATIAGPAIRLADGGFPMGEHLRASLDAAPDMNILFQADNRRPGLAEALRAWAATDGEAFRSGWVAQDFVDAAQRTNGTLSMADLAAYTVQTRAPLRASFGERTVLTMPPPSSGGIALLQLLGAVSGGTTIHCEVEAAKHAMADRSAYGGDPAFARVDVPALLAPARIESMRKDCAETTFLPEHYANPIAVPDDHGTLHISVMDAEGWAVALTTTVNTSFGSHVVATRSGIVLNNEMDDFATRRGQPNAFGLVQGESNVVQAGKRPLSSMTPTVVIGADGRPELAVGGSGGPFIITATWQVLQNVLVKGMTAEAAVAAPRWHHQWMPNAALVETAFGGADDLRAHGHDVRVIEKPFSAVQVVVRTAGGFDAASDPRKGGKPAWERGPQ
ncbi:gamma-glutamyltransferase [Deltaproteobacteria bacterium]|nr:gamma-glutamyltransferase [Deltaproteobacteria bacterium]